MKFEEVERVITLISERISSNVIHPLEGMIFEIEDFDRVFYYMYNSSILPFEKERPILSFGWMKYKSQSGVEVYLVKDKIGLKNLAKELNKKAVDKKEVIPVKSKTFSEIVRPVIEWLNETNKNPHISITITQDSATLQEDIEGYKTLEFIKN